MLTRRILALALVLAACGPISKAPRAPFKAEFRNVSTSSIEFRVSGLGDKSWPDTSWPEPAPPPEAIQLQGGGWTAVYWDHVPAQLYISTFHTANVLAFGRDYGSSGVQVTLP